MAGARARATGKTDRHSMFRAPRSAIELGRPVTSMTVRRFQLLLALALLVGTGLLVRESFSQRGGGRGASRFAELERRSVAEPFIGIQTDGRIERGLFPVGSTGVSTVPVVEAAKGFLASLPDGLRRETQFPVDHPEWRRWANQHSLPRYGVSFEDLSAAQRETAFALIRSGLSDRGFDLARDIMRLNYSLGEITSNFEELDEWMYYLTVMGAPSIDQPWGWQLDGHHLIVNYFVLGDQVVMTPTFVGSEPVVAEAGKYKGVAVLQNQQQAGLDLARALDDTQRSKAVLSTEKDGNNSVAEAFSDNANLDLAGIRADELKPRQQELLLQIVEGFVGIMSDDHAVVKMREVRRHLDRTYFAWIGGLEEDSVFYYRVHSPVILVEFDHQRPIFMRLPRVPTRQHIHAVMRTPNGNDYGKDLLRQHYESSHRAELDP